MNNRNNPCVSFLNDISSIIDALNDELTKYVVNMDAPDTICVSNNTSFQAYASRLKSKINNLIEEMEM